MRLLTITGILLDFAGVYLLMTSGGFWEQTLWWPRPLRDFTRRSKIFERDIPYASLWGVTCLIIGTVLILIGTIFGQS